MRPCVKSSIRGRAVNDLHLIVTIVGAAVGATWVLSWTIAKGNAALSKALAKHALDDVTKHAELEAKIIKLEGRRRK